MKHRTSTQTGWIIPGAVLVLLLTLAACYAIPFKLAFGPNSSWYLFGYNGDEYTYAYRIQPLPPGVSAANPVNPVVDSRVISPFYLEDTCRVLVRAIGGSPITFFWVWRFVFPTILLLSAGAMGFFIFEPRLQRRWSHAARWAVSAAVLPMMMVLYEVVTHYPPFQGWMYRIPTNIEFPLSLAIAGCAVRFVRRPTPHTVLWLSISLAALWYLRFYNVIPWLAALAAIVTWQVAKKEMPLRLAMIFAAVMALLMAPWLAVSVWNSSIDTFHQLMLRYFGQPQWMVSPFWKLYVCVGVILILIGSRIPSSLRVLPMACGVSIASLSVLIGVLPFAKELHALDRMGSFYLVALAMSAALWASSATAQWPGIRGARRGKTLSAGVLGMSAAGSLGLLFYNANIDFDAYPASPYPTARADLACVPGYLWVRDHTPADALFVVDDGWDWSRFVRPDDQARAWKEFTMKDDLFSCVAQRSRVHHIRIYGNAITDQEYILIKSLHYGIVGMPSDMEIRYQNYVRAFNAMRPTHIFWKKTAPFPRAMGIQLKKLCKTIYSDDACEVWEIETPAQAAPADPVSAGPQPQPSAAPQPETPPAP